MSRRRRCFLLRKKPTTCHLPPRLCLLAAFTPLQRLDRQVGIAITRIQGVELDAAPARRFGVVRPVPSCRARSDYSGFAFRSHFLSNVLSPEVGLLVNEATHQGDALTIIGQDHLDAAIGQKVEIAGEIFSFADHQPGD